MHKERRYGKVDKGGNEQSEKLEELGFALLPYHQRGDIAKGREGAAGVCSHYQVGAGNSHEGWRVAAERHHDGPHQKNRGEVVKKRRKTKSADAGNPKKTPVAQLVTDEPGSQRLEHPAFLESVDISDRHQEKKEQLAIFEDGMGGSIVCLLTAARL